MFFRLGEYVLAQPCHDGLASDEVFEGNQAVDFALQIVQVDEGQTVQESCDQRQQPKNCETLVHTTEEETGLDDQHHSDEADHGQCQVTPADGFLNIGMATLYM